MLVVDRSVIEIEGRVGCNTDVDAAEASLADEAIEAPSVVDDMFLERLR